MENTHIQKDEFVSSLGSFTQDRLDYVNDFYCFNCYAAHSFRYNRNGHSSVLPRR